MNQTGGTNTDMDQDDLGPIVNKYQLIDLNYGEFRIDSLAEVS